jgi:hypothetical protein
MAAQLAVAFLALLSSSAFLAVSGQKFNAIFSFGDSMSDTGNLCVNGPPAGLTLTQPPYGETFFGRATCRCSDGRLVVDFLGGYRTLCSHARTHVLTFNSNAPIGFPSKKDGFALLDGDERDVAGMLKVLFCFCRCCRAAEKFGLPLLKPSKQGGSDFKQGANMAIIGATTMDSGFFQSLGIADKIWNNGPLNTQIQWFQELMPSICGSTQGTYVRGAVKFRSHARTTHAWSMDHGRR